MPSALVPQHPGPGPGLAPGPSLDQPGTPRPTGPRLPAVRPPSGPSKAAFASPHVSAAAAGTTTLSGVRVPPAAQSSAVGRARPVHSAAAAAEAQGGRRERGGGSGLRRGEDRPAGRGEGGGGLRRRRPAGARAPVSPPSRRGVRAPEGGGAFSAEGGGAHARTQPRLTPLGPESAEYKPDRRRAKKKGAEARETLLQARGRLPISPESD